MPSKPRTVSGSSSLAFPKRIFFRPIHEAARQAERYM
jgi:hypothetical protein